MSEFVTHDMKRFVVSRPADFRFTPGQGVELAIDTPAWRDQGRPFTPTLLVHDQALEFTIKAYPERAGVTRELHDLHPGAELLLSKPFGTIQYRGPGTFVAGGAGITPFLAILRELARRDKLAGHRLIFANRTPADVICEKELRHALGEHGHFICTAAPAPGFEHRRIGAAYLRETVGDPGQHFYLCGPPGFMDAVTTALHGIGADPEALVFEQ